MAELTPLERAIVRVVCDTSIKNATIGDMWRIISHLDAEDVFKERPALPDYITEERAWRG